MYSECAEGRARKVPCFCGKYDSLLNDFLKKKHTHHMMFGLFEDPAAPGFTFRYRAVVRGFKFVSSTVHPFLRRRLY